MSHAHRIRRRLLRQGRELLNVRHSMNAALALALVMSAGCAIHLRAPEPDVGRPKAVAPAPKEAHIAVVARLSNVRLAAMLNRITVKPIEMGRDATLASWKLKIRREGDSKVRASQEHLCLELPFVGEGHVAWLGKRLRHVVRAAVSVCAQPELTPEGNLRLRKPTTSVRLRRQTIARTTAILYDQLEAVLKAQVGPLLSRELAKKSISMVEVLAPIHEGLTRPMKLPDGACLKLRPGLLRLARPEVDPTHVRLALSVLARPTIERPCVPEPPSKDQIRLQVVPRLRHPQTRLRLPVGVALGGLQKELSGKLKAMGRIRTKDGWVEVTGLTLKTARHVVLAKAAIRGEVKSRWLGMDWRREVSGDVLLWDRPTAGPKWVGLRQLKLMVQSDDALADLAVAMRRDGLVEIATRQLRWPRSDVDKRARALVTGLARPLTFAGERIPLSIDTRRLELVAVSAHQGRIEIDFDFAGYVVLGDTRRR